MTVTIDEDVAAVLRPLLAHGEPKEVINDLLRQAPGIRKASKVDLPTFNLGLREGIDPVSLNKLATTISFDSRD